MSQTLIQGSQASRTLRVLDLLEKRMSEQFKDYIRSLHREQAEYDYEDETNCRAEVRKQVSKMVELAQKELISEENTNADRIRRRKRKLKKLMSDLKKDRRFKLIRCTVARRCTLSPPRIETPAKQRFKSCNRKSLFLDIVEQSAQKARSIQSALLPPETRRVRDSNLLINEIQSRCHVDELVQAKLLQVYVRGRLPFHINEGIKFMLEDAEDGGLTIFSTPCKKNNVYRQTSVLEIPDIAIIECLDKDDAIKCTPGNSIAETNDTWSRQFISEDLDKVQGSHRSIEWGVDSQIEEYIEHPQLEFLSSNELYESSASVTQQQIQVEEIEIDQAPVADTKLETVVETNENMESSTKTSETSVSSAHAVQNKTGGIINQQPEVYNQSSEQVEDDQQCIDTGKEPVLISPNVNYEEQGGVKEMLIEQATSQKVEEENKLAGSEKELYSKQENTNQEGSSDEESFGARGKRAQSMFSSISAIHASQQSIEIQDQEIDLSISLSKGTNDEADAEASAAVQANEAQLEKQKKEKPIMKKGSEPIKTGNKSIAAKVNSVKSPPKNLQAQGTKTATKKPNKIIQSPSTNKQKEAINSKNSVEVPELQRRNTVAAAPAPKKLMTPSIKKSGAVASTPKSAMKKVLLKSNTQATLKIDNSLNAKKVKGLENPPQVIQTQRDDSNEQENQSLSTIDELIVSTPRQRTMTCPEIQKPKQQEKAQNTPQSKLKQTPNKTKTPLTKRINATSSEVPAPKVSNLVRNRSSTVNTPPSKTPAQKLAVKSAATGKTPDVKTTVKKTEMPVNIEVPKMGKSNSMVDIKVIQEQTDKVSNNRKQSVVSKGSEISQEKPQSKPLIASTKASNPDETKSDKKVQEKKSVKQAEEKKAKQSKVTFKAPAKAKVSNAKAQIKNVDSTLKKTYSLKA